MMRESSGGGDQVMVPSSIAVALLQERFRQLRRVKEMREGRDQLLVRTTALSLTERCSPTPTTPHYYFQPSNSNSNSLIFRSETVTPRPPSTAPPAAACQVSLSLWPKNSDAINSHAHQLWSFDMPNSYSNSWPTTTAAAPTTATKALAEALLPPIKFQDYSDSDVDTSLHL